MKHRTVLQSFIVATSVVAVAVVGACVGDATSNPILVQVDASSLDASGQGGVGQPCYGNGSCNSGLSCLSQLCVASDSGSGSPNDAGTNETDAGAADGATEAGCPACTAANNCMYPSAAAGCVYGSGSGYCFNSSPACYTGDSCDDFQFNCRTNVDCSGATPACCANLPQGPSCGGAIPFANPVTFCEATCDTDYYVCSSEAVCQAIDTRLHCIAMTATAAPNTQTIGICAQL